MESDIKDLTEETLSDGTIKRQYFNLKTHRNETEYLYPSGGKQITYLDYLGENVDFTSRPNDNHHDYYNASGELIKSETKVFSTDQTRISEYDYTDNSTTTTTTIYDKGNNVEGKEVTYEANGFYEKTVSDKDGIVSKQTTFQVNSNNDNLNDDETHYKYENYRDPEKSYTDVIKWDENGEEKGNQHFNSDGKLIKQVTYGRDGVDDYSSINEEYDPETGKILKSYEHSRKDDSWTETEYGYYSNLNGEKELFSKTVKSDSKYVESEEGYYEYTYNDDGTVTEKHYRAYTDENGKKQYYSNSLSEKTLYDSNGNKIVYTVIKEGGDNFDSDGDPWKTQEFRYDEAGNLVSTKFYNQDGKLVSDVVSSSIVFEGNTYTFSATALNEVVKSLEKSKTTLKSILDDIGSEISEISPIARSSDASGTNLANTLDGVSNACTQATNSFVESLDTIKEAIDLYVQKSISNEQSTSEELNNINAQLDSLNF